MHTESVIWICMRCVVGVHAIHQLPAATRTPQYDLLTLCLLRLLCTASLLQLHLHPGTAAARL